MRSSIFDRTWPGRAYLGLVFTGDLRSVYVMPNNPNDTDPKPGQPDPKKPVGKPKSSIRPEDAEPPESVPIEGLEDPAVRGGLSDPELYLRDPKAPDSVDEMLPTVNPRTTPESAIFENLRSPGDSQLFESLKPDSKHPDSLFENVVPTVDSTHSSDSSLEMSGLIPTADPASGSNISKRRHDPDAAVGNLEPIDPVSPASGWLDSDVPLPQVGSGSSAGPLSAEQADLFEAPPTVESSDIFSTGSAPPAKPSGGSDVLNATAYGEAAPADPDKPSRPSDIALSFDQPPGGSTIDSNDNSGDLPVAEEVPYIDPLFDSARLGTAAPLDDAPEYGSTPEITQDASSILADLSNPGDVTINDSSAIRLDSPGVERTLNHPSSGTEFDLTIGEGEIPPELAAAAEAAESGVPPPWPRKKPSDPEQRTTPEIDIDSERVQPIDSRLRPDDPSSIFDSINDPVVFRRPGETERTEDEDAAVEFSDHPDADSDPNTGSSSSLFGPAPPSVRRPTPRPTSEHEFELPAEPAGDSGVLNWRGREDEEKESRGESSSILNRGRPAKPRSDAETDPDAVTRAAAPLSSTPRPKQPTTRPLKGSPPEEIGGPRGVELDWVAGSSSEAPPVKPPPSTRTPAPRKAKDKERPAREPAGAKKSGTLVGAMIGAGIALAASTGIYLSGAIPNSPKPTTQTKQTNPEPQGGSPDGTGGQPATATLLPGQGRLFAKIQELGKVNAAVAAADDADVRKAREELQAVADDTEVAKTAAGERKAVEATIYLGVSHEIANERDQAKKVYEAAIKKFPKYAQTFQSALDRLDATDSRPSGMSRGLTPAEAEQLLLAIVLLQDDPRAATEVEAGVYFWKAVKSANEGKYTEAIDQIKLAKDAHIKQAKANPGRAVNPLSDPLEQIFPRSCDDLKAYWELRAAIYSNKAIADLMKKDGPDKALIEMAKRADSAVRLMVDLKTANAALTKSRTELTTANTNLKTAQTQLKIASDKVTVAEKDLTIAKDLAGKFEKEYKTAEAARIVVEKKLTEEATARATADTARKRGDELISALAKELQAAKLLPEKFDDAALLAAQKTVATRATGPTLNALMPSGMMAVGGGGLTAGQLGDIADRLTRAETAAKAADLRFTTETKKLKDDHAIAVKKLTDDYASETKKLMDGYASNTSKLKDGHAAEVKKMADKFVANMKKTTEAYDTKVKSLEAAVVEEKKAAEALAAKFKVDLGAALSPAQTLDVWLPLLTDLRRASDAEPALATATKVLSTSPADSEDSAKARTVAGLAHFLKGDMTKAKEMFLSAKASPAYKAAAGKPWATTADVGLQSIDDPLAQLRRPVEVLKRDPRSAARHLDAGVKAYKAGRFTDAVTALAESAKADPTDPVAWYFLGAAKWETVGAEQAKKEFEQGAEHEKRSPLPARMIGDSLSPIQGAARDALTAARP